MRGEASVVSACLTWVISISSLSAHLLWNLTSTLWFSSWDLRSLLTCKTLPPFSIYALITLVLMPRTSSVTSYLQILRDGLLETMLQFTLDTNVRSGKNPQLQSGEELQISSYWSALVFCSTSCSTATLMIDNDRWQAHSTDLSAEQHPYHSSANDNLPNSSYIYMILGDVCG